MKLVIPTLGHLQSAAANSMLRGITEEISIQFKQQGICPKFEIYGEGAYKPASMGEENTEGISLCLMGTGGSEAGLLQYYDAQQKRANKHKGIIVLTHGSMNSLPAGLEAAAKLRRDGAKVTLFHLDKEESLRLFSTAIRTRMNLKASSIYIYIYIL